MAIKFNTSSLYGGDTNEYLKQRKMGWATTPSLDFTKPVTAFSPTGGKSFAGIGDYKEVTTGLDAGKKLSKKEFSMSPESADAVGMVANVGVNLLDTYADNKGVKYSKTGEIAKGISDFGTKNFSTLAAMGPIGLGVAGAAVLTSAGLRGNALLNKKASDKVGITKDINTDLETNAYTVEGGEGEQVTGFGLWKNKKRTKKIDAIKDRRNAALNQLKTARGNESAQKNISNASSAMLQDTVMRNQNQLTNANLVQSLLAKDGAKLSLLKEYIKTKDVKKFAEGGKFNVIPSGALHSQLNKLGGEITKKGIPVILGDAEVGDVIDLKEEGGSIEQQAEVEREELTLHIDLTKKLEKLMKDGSKEAMLEAGKLFTFELFENTRDNVGLIDKIVENEN